MNWECFSCGEEWKDDYFATVTECPDCGSTNIVDVGYDLID